MGKKQTEINTTDDLQALSLRTITSTGVLNEQGPTSVRLIWRKGAAITGTAIVQTSSNNLKINYQIANDEKTFPPIEEQLTIIKTPTYRGGHRRWLACPGCGGRCSVMYSQNGYFRCRSCEPVRYTSQNCTAIDNYRTQARKIRERLNASMDLSIPITCKPRKMRTTTFKRLIEKEKHYNKAALVDMKTRLDRLSKEITTQEKQ